MVEGLKLKDLKSLEPSIPLNDANRSFGRLWLPLAGLSLVFAVLLHAGLHKVDQEKVSAFRTYYTAATALREGRSPYETHAGAYAYVYPPLYAFLCEPLAELSRSNAARVMLAFNWALLLAVLLAGSWSILNRLSRPADFANVLWLAFFTALIAICPVVKELLSFQSDFLILASFVFALVWLDEHPVLSGTSLAVGIAAKYLPIIAVPYLLIRRRWLAACTAVVGAALLTLLPATSLGWSRNLHYLVLSNGGLARILGAPLPESSARTHSLADPLNISASGSLARFAQAMRWPESVALAMTAAVFLIWLGILLKLHHPKDDPLLVWPSARIQKTQPYRGWVAVEWAGLLTAAMAFAPNTNLLLAVVPIMLLIAQMPSPSPRVSKWMMPVATALVLVALVLPVAVMGQRFTTVWNSLGAPSWLLLIAYVLAYVASKTTLFDRQGRAITHDAHSPPLNGVSFEGIDKHPALNS